MQTSALPRRIDRNEGPVAGDKRESGNPVDGAFAALAAAIGDGAGVQTLLSRLAELRRRVEEMAVVFTTAAAQAGVEIRRREELLANVTAALDVATLGIKNRNELIERGTAALERTIEGSARLVRLNEELRQILVARN